MRNLPGIKKGVILLSGGLDSVTTLYCAKSKGYRLTALVFDYGQRHGKEIKLAKKIARINNLNYFVKKIDLSWTKSSLTNRRIKMPSGRNLKSKSIPSTYVAGRNIIFLTYAFSLAESIGARKIFIGAHVQDYSGYPDCRPEFIYSFQESANLGLKSSKIKIVAPLIDKSKTEIIELGLELKVPFHDTWSCYNGGKRPCLRCDSCRFRMRAFKQLGLIDPILKRNKP
ncbi:MAG: 7-cyano-7-deazaguanine synthase QueC [Candidatus Omnitrophica bacterium]|nr:7-cyano-7-deazaguanine synthase QueC [Candidatus Omnitrophota bacterium]MBU2045084.1 7-cyano-7-deazaguanine synthase QueC [Candidatus Omnitrophota bacterium]MBU2473179.1 7-cyano-7-deazaguanine synthase QueC [Candidatus Omnitrophota bacterium]